MTQEGGPLLASGEGGVALRYGASGETRRRSRTMGVGAVALLTVSLSGCNGTPEYVGVCANRQAGLRVPDEECADASVMASGNPAWYWIPVGGNAPAVGDSVTGGWYVLPRDARSWDNDCVPSEGGYVDYGGFGSCSSTAFGG